MSEMQATIRTARTLTQVPDRSTVISFDDCDGVAALPRALATAGPNMLTDPKGARLLETFQEQLRLANGLDLCRWTLLDLHCNGWFPVPDCSSSELLASVLASHGDATT